MSRNLNLALKIILSVFLAVASLNSAQAASNENSKHPIFRKPASAGDYACLQNYNNKPIVDLNDLADTMNRACDKSKAMQIFQKTDNSYVGCCVWL